MKKRVYLVISIGYAKRLNLVASSCRRLRRLRRRSERALTGISLRLMDAATASRLRLGWLGDRPPEATRRKV
jgi:hypothetical protein